MPAQPVYLTYASVTEFRDYLAGSNFSAGWTADGAVVLRILEAASRTMEQYLGGRTWGPRLETRLYDLGRGSLRSDRSLAPGFSDFTTPDYWPGRLTSGSIVPLDDWLVTATTVTAYADTARSSSTVLTEGITGDYLLEPYNESPKTLLKLQEETVNALGAGQQTLSIAGTWGWQNVSRAVTAALNEALDATETAIDVVSGAAFAAGQTLRIEAEQVYVSSISTNTLTVVRGVNGTTAAAHSTGLDVAILEYPADIVSLCLEIARNRWKDRDAGIGQAIGSPEFAMTRPGAEEKALLRRLDVYRGKRDLGGVYV